MSELIARKVRISKLVDMKIPAHTECPFKDTCAFKEADQCLHNGLTHHVPFSCGAARAYDLIQNPRQ